MVKEICCLLLFLTFSACSNEPMSYLALRARGIFPKEVEKRKLAKPPSSFDSSQRGYIHAAYVDKEERYITIEVIDKVFPEKAEKWLQALLNGMHTSSTIEPIPYEALSASKLAELEEFKEALTISGVARDGVSPRPLDILSTDGKKWCKEFLENPIDVMGNQGYEKIEEAKQAPSSSSPRYFYYLYYTQGRFVVMVSTTPHEDIDKLGDEIWSILASLKLSE